MKKDSAELFIKTFLPLCITITNPKNYPAMTEDGRYYILSFKRRGRGKGRGGRNMLPDELINARRKFLMALHDYPETAAKYGIKCMRPNSSTRIIMIKKEVVENFPKI